MSWELDYISITPCPCGKGTLEQKHYSDDWNRFRDDDIEICCENCKLNFKVVTNIGKERKPKHGVPVTNFIVPINDETLENAQIIIFER